MDKESSVGLLKGKVAVVLGGNGGIGRACCRALLSKGVKVCCADIVDADDFRNDLEKSYDVDKNIIFVKCDVTIDEDVKKMFSKTAEHFGKKPEIVLTAAAIIDEFNWQKCIDINVSGCIRLVNEAIRVMGLKNGGNGGSIILLGSVSSIQPSYWGPIYGATKYAQIGLVRSLAEEMNYKRHGIRFNCLCPGGVDTPFLKQIEKSHFSDIHQKYLDEHPLLKPESVADAFVKLLDDDTMNGAAIVINHAGEHLYPFPESYPP